jgi:hypothetical protein
MVLENRIKGTTVIHAWTATIMLAGVAAKVLAGDVESKAA